MAAQTTKDSEPAGIPIAARPVWRSRLGARAPRVIAGGLALMLMIAGVRSVLAGPPPAPRLPYRAATGDRAVESFAEAFARAYLAWDPQRPELQQDAVARYAVDDLDAGAGVDQGEPQTVLWTAPLGSERHAGRALVTIEAATDRGSYRLVVPVERDRDGLLAVVDYPALVGPAATSLRRSAASRREVEDAQLRTVAGRAVRNYLAGERRNLLADLDPAALVSLPDRPLEVDSIDAVEWASPGHVAVRVSATEGASPLVLSYELTVVKRERWYVRLISVNPIHPNEGRSK